MVQNLLRLPIWIRHLPNGSDIVLPTLVGRPFRRRDGDGQGFIPVLAVVVVLDNPRAGTARPFQKLQA